MHELTVRNIDDELYAALERAAQQRDMSVNEYVVDVLKQSIQKVNGVSGQRIYHDLDWFFGTWTEEEADEFDRIIMEGRTIDPEIWK